ncbi:unnamed protein product [Paramecium octaurelia]|uniref:Uncharacterized protein n=1 Tax=Paramecium octaurelia TaxID=43137 RepID=A0A8S1XA68_PAROT|nr:unnamed protein product [Paramecium octaurelia]
MSQNQGGQNINSQRSQPSGNQDQQQQGAQNDNQEQVQQEASKMLDHITKEKEDQLSPIDFLLYKVKEDFKDTLRESIQDFLEKYQNDHQSNLINMRTHYCFCMCKAPFEINDFKKSTGIDQSGVIKRFYGNIYFNDQASNFIIYQVVNIENIKQYFNEDQYQLKLIEKYNKNYNTSHYEKNYQDFNSGYFYGKRCGLGCEVTSEKQNLNRKLYIGEFFNNKYHGKGTLKDLPMDNQEDQTDQFFAGEKEKEIFKFLYNPEIEKNKDIKPKVIKEDQDLGGKNGKGTYHGEVNEQNQKNGWGVFEFKNRNKYKGQWKDDKMHGTGHFTWANGEEYLGEYYNDKKHGFGRYTYQNKKEYLGQFYQGRQHGLALMKNSQSFNLQTEWNYGQFLV